MGNCLKISTRNNRVSSSFDLNGRNSVYQLPEHPRYPPPPNRPPRLREAWTESRNNPYIINHLENDKIIPFGVHSDSECCICLENSPNVYLNCYHHQFCYSCISQLVKFNYSMNKVPKCPICREVITCVSMGYTLEFKTGFVV